MNRRATFVSTLTVSLLAASIHPVTAAPRPPEYEAIRQRLARGWNTWNSRSVLSWSVLPEGFGINLAFQQVRPRPPHLRRPLHAPASSGRAQPVGVRGRAHAGSRGPPVAEYLRGRRGAAHTGTKRSQMKMTSPRTPRQLYLMVLIAAGLALPLLAGDTDDANWPQFRGPAARGVADGRTLPETWNVADGTNVKWKTAIPGLAHSSPVIWDDAILVTTSISGVEDPYLKVGLYGNIDPVEDDTKHKFVVYRVDAASGKIVWERTAFEGVPKIKRHQKSSHANPTPATDGKHVIALFGSEGIYAYDMDGKLLWKKDLGVLDSGYFEVPTAQWGFGSSPIIHDGRVIVQADVQEGSFLAAFDVETGKELWRTDRNDVPTWSTPTVHADGSRSQVLVNGYKHLGGYDLKDGKELWRMRGTGDIPIPTPYVVDGLVFFTSAHGEGSPIYAVRTSASGDVSLGADELANEQVAWSHPRGGSYMPTTLVYRDLLYVLRDNGVLGVYDIKTGERRYEQRLGDGSGGFTASVVAGDGKLYFTAEMGEVHVVKPGPEFELLATNEMDEICMATPAIASGTLYYRTRGHLVALAAKGTPSD